MRESDRVLSGDPAQGGQICRRTAVALHPDVVEVLDLDADLESATADGRRDYGVLGMPPGG